jgi:hypothetical protein
MTGIAMSIDMPPRDHHVNLRCFGDSHMFGEVFHTFSKVLGPLADDIVGDDDAEEGYAN